MVCFVCHSFGICNPTMPDGLCHPYILDESFPVSGVSGGRVLSKCRVYYFIQYNILTFDKNSCMQTSVDPDEMLRSTASDLGLNCLPRSHLSHIIRKPVYAIYANNNNADQLAHPGSLISAFVFRCLDSIPLVSISKIASLYLTSVAAQAGLSLPWSQTLKTGFLVTWFIYGTPVIYGLSCKRSV